MSKWLIILIFLIGATSCSVGGYITYTGDNDKEIAQARLTDAYSTFDRCGTKGRYSCEVFKGRYWLPEHEIVVDKNIDGFTYKAFKEKGRAELMDMEFHKSTLYGRKSMWWFTLCAFGVMCNVMFFLYLTFEDIKIK